MVIVVKDIGPSTALRKWLGHDPARWAEFHRRHAVEVHQQPESLDKLRALARREPLTLIFSARDEGHDDAVALRSFLTGRTVKPKPGTASPGA